LARLAVARRMSPFLSGRASNRRGAEDAERTQRMFLIGRQTDKNTEGAEKNIVKKNPLEKAAFLYYKIIPVGREWGYKWPHRKLF